MHSSPVIKRLQFLLLLRYVTQQNIQSFNPTGMTNKRWNFWKYNSMVAMLQTYSRFRITLLSHQRNVADTQFCNQASLCRMVVLKSSALFQKDLAEKLSCPARILKRLKGEHIPNYQGREAVPPTHLWLWIGLKRERRYSPLNSKMIHVLGCRRR